VPSAENVAADRASLCASWKQAGTR